MTVKITIIEPKSFKGFWKNPADKMNNAINIGLFRIGHKIANRSKEFSPQLTGNLRRSITVDPQLISQVDNKIAVGSNLVYARIHDLGGIIKPKNKKYLHFKTKSGKWVRTKKVTIKKYKGRGYLTPAFDWASRSIVEPILTQEINAIMK